MEETMPERIKIGEDIVIQVNDPTEALRMLAVATMRPFTKEDWYGFSGCESKEPMIGELEDFSIVLDAATLNICHGEDGYGGTLFELIRRN
jgi:hypothetical protein